MRRPYIIFLAMLVTMLVMVFVWERTSRGGDNADPIKDKFYAEQSALMEAHKALLVQSGHMSKDFDEIERYLGTFDWRTGSHGYFGAYAFSPAAYEQSKRSWFGNFNVVEGSNELWSGAFGEALKFDASVIGRRTPSMSMVWMKDGVFHNDWFDAKIIGIKDEGRTLMLDKHAPHNAKQFNAVIKPDDWVDLCACVVGGVTQHTPQQLAIGHRP